MTEEAYNYLLGLGYLRHDEIYAIYMGQLDAASILNREHYEEYCWLNGESPEPEPEFTPMTEEQVEAVETAISWLEANLRKNQEKQRRIAADRNKHNEKVKQSYKLKK